MNNISAMVRFAWVLSIGCGCVWPLGRAAAAESNASIPPVLEAGFTLWAKGGGVDVVLSEWQKGGLLEGDNKAIAQADYFKRINRIVGNYQAYELLERKAIGRTSAVIYLSLNFERGAVYARFLLYRTAKTWVVQNMDFSTKPEAVMPWLAFEGEKGY